MYHVPEPFTPSFRNCIRQKNQTNKQTNKNPLKPHHFLELYYSQEPRRESYSRNGKYLGRPDESMCRKH